MNLRIIFLFALSSLSTTLSAAEQQCHQQGKFRIFYHTGGQHAVDTTDANHNVIPDQVEDIMTQILAARMMFVEELGFPDPFNTDHRFELR